MIVGTAGILCFTALVVPKIMTKTYAAMLTVRAKAVERTKGEYGDTVVYIPSASCRQYIRRYSIGHDKEGLFFVGDLAASAAFCEFELTVFNADNEIVQILRVKEKFNATGKTSLVRLPQNTDYVSLRLVCIDDDPVPAERRKFNPSFALWLAALCACIATAADILVWLITSFLIRLKDDFEMTLDLPMSTWAAILGFTALAVVVTTCAVALSAFFLRERGEK